MPSALIAKELVASLPAKIGLLAEVAAAIRAKGVNIKAVSAYEGGGEGKFLLVTDDNAKAAEALKSMGADPREKSVVMADLEDRPGALEEAAKTLADAGINIEYVYGASGLVGKARLVFSTSDDVRACSLL
jgi:hypothetical protein